MGEDGSSSTDSAVQALRDRLKGPKKELERFNRAARVLFAPTKSVGQVLEALSHISLGRAELDRAFGILTTLDEYTFEDEPIAWPSELSSSDFLLWVMATATRNKATGGIPVDSRFVGATRVQKLCYFAREYKVPDTLQFSYDAWPFGVYSPDVLASLSALDAGQFVKKPKKMKLGDELASKEHTFPITPKGAKRYGEICELLLDRVGIDNLDSTRRVIDYLYGQDARTLGLASKVHFTWAYWLPFQRLQTEEFYGFLLAGVPDDKKEALTLFAERLQKYQSYLELHNSPYELSSDVDALLRRCMVPGSYDSRRFFVFENSGIPTNYFVPVEAMQVNPFLLRLLAARVGRQVDALLGFDEKPTEEAGLRRSVRHRSLQGVDCLVVAQSGLAADIARLLAGEGPLKPGPMLVGPFFRRGEAVEDFAEYAACHGKKCVVLTDTIMTGETTSAFVRGLSNAAGAIILGVVAVSDRGIGGLETVRTTGFEVRVMYPKASVLWNLKTRFGHTTVS